MLKVGGKIIQQCANVGIKLLDDDYPTPLYKKCIDKDRCKVREKLGDF